MEPDLKPHVDRRIVLLEKTKTYDEKKLLKVIKKLLREENELMGEKRKVTDVLKVGDKVTVTVLDVNPEKGKISLSLKDLNADPWNTAAEKYAVGNVVTGKVVRMVPFGAFVELEEGVDGLVHISQIAYKHVEKPEDELTVGQEIQAKVTELDLDNKKISLSIKETLEKPSKSEETENDAE